MLFKLDLREFPKKFYSILVQKFSNKLAGSFRKLSKKFLGIKYRSKRN
jgi:hypothetical protein